MLERRQHLVEYLAIEFTGCSLDGQFGALARILSRLPHEPRVLESGSKTRVLEVQLDSGDPITIPRANVELIEE